MPNDQAAGYLSDELLGDACDPGYVVTRGQRRALTQGIDRELDKAIWQRRLVSLIEGELTQTLFHCARCA